MNEPFKFHYYVWLGPKYASVFFLKRGIKKVRKDAHSLKLNLFVWNYLLLYHWIFNIFVYDTDTGLFLYTLETSRNQMFCNVFRG